ncbi:hypothetical protein [Nonomuraea rhizosphaerae]|uniref:hypothetical protein n=1 Tax=Nonomuraea rhizosphaerae TaxID=2665663 RepID=UPI001C5D1288|nr:hypothetical protein [Nonomuraea rhizosphaerae]
MLIAEGQYAYQRLFRAEMSKEARRVLETLEDRGISVPDELRERILLCLEEDKLQIWLDLAHKVRRAEDLFPPVYLEMIRKVEAEAGAGS